MTGALHHVEIYVADLSRTVNFWSWFLTELGYSKYQQWDCGISYRLGETYLVFVQAEDQFREHTFHRCHPGLNHLAFHAASREQVDTLTTQIAAHGGKILYPDRHPYAGGSEYYALFFEDPDRLKVELVAPI